MRRSTWLLLAHGPARPIRRTKERQSRGNTTGSRPLALHIASPPQRLTRAQSRLPRRRAAPSGFFDECWVEFEPGVSEAGKASLAARFATGAADPVVRPVRRSDEFTRDPAAEWESRPQKHGWVAVTIALSGFIVAAAWFRRSEAALYMATGTGRLELVVMSAAEHWPIVALGWCIGYSYAVSAHLSWGEGAAMDFARHAAVTSGAAAILLLPASACANALIARGNIAALLKDR